MESEQVRHEVYRIVVQGQLDREWSEWLEGLTITRVSSGETILSGPLADQAALHGVLIKIRDLGLPLLALERLAPVRAQESNRDIPTEEEEGAG
jgi:hypothetical protein